MNFISYHQDLTMNTMFKTTISLIALIFFLFACVPSQPNNMSEKDKKLLKGKRLFSLRGCSSCHGYQGDGKGDRTGMMRPKPRDFKNMDEYHSLLKTND